MGLIAELGVMKMNNEVGVTEKEDALLSNLCIGMIGFGIIIQILVFVVSDALLYDSLGLWIGIAIGACMLWHMKRTIEDALDIGEEQAAKHMVKKSIMRTSCVAVAFLILGYIQMGSMLTALIGLLGLKISVYSQPYIYKVRRKLRKGG